MLISQLVRLVFHRLAELMPPPSLRGVGDVRELANAVNLALPP
jgi:hypothetical protein